jgi:hypothetical protein
MEQKDRYSLLESQHLEPLHGSDLGATWYKQTAQ